MPWPEPVVNEILNAMLSLQKSPGYHSRDFFCFCMARKNDAEKYLLCCGVKVKLLLEIQVLENAIQRDLEENNNVVYPVYVTLKVIK